MLRLKDWNLTYPLILTKMKRISNNVVSELIRLVPVLIENMPETRNTRLINAVRQTKLQLKKLEKLKDITD